MVVRRKMFKRIARNTLPFEQVRVHMPEDVLDARDLAVYYLAGVLELHGHELLRGLHGRTLLDGVLVREEALRVALAVRRALCAARLGRVARTVLQVRLQVALVMLRRFPALVVLVPVLQLQHAYSRVCVSAAIGARRRSGGESGQEKIVEL